MHVQSPVAAVLCLLLVHSPPTLMAQPSFGEAKRPAYHGQIQGDQRIVHALNRFTFGPRPGDVEAVKAQGLDQWFEQQLHPESMPDSALAARLAEYPAMRLSPPELIARFPSNAVIRQVIDGKAQMPERGILRVVYENQIARVQAKKEEKAAAGSSQASINSTSPKSAEMAQRARPSDQAMMAAQRMEIADEAKPSSAPIPDRTEEVLALAPGDRIARLVQMPQPELDAFLRGLKGPDRKALLDGLTPEMRETIGDLEAPERTITGELMAERLTRETYSEAQLQEVMTDFWLNHFNVFLRKNEAMPYLLVSYERDVIRPRALGNFEDLLEAVAHSPAMLLYLDQSESTGPDSIAAVRAQFRNPKKRGVGLNENYARELMELHTLGVNGGYTQADVVQAARILTGWTVDRPQRGGGFRFDENRHEPGSKKVIGQKFKDKGEKEGQELLHFLATRAATARFISRKLAVRFVTDDPSQALVDRMAKTFESTHGDIASVLRTMYRSPEFWSQEAYRAKVKTPLEFVISAARASNADVKDMRPVIENLRQMGMPLYGCVPPTGYKEDAADWVSTGALVSRMNFALGLSAGRLQGVAPKLDSNSEDQDAAAAEARLELALVAGGVSESTRNAVLDQFAQQSRQVDLKVRPAGATAQQKQQALLAGLLLGSPEFQRR